MNPKSLGAETMQNGTDTVEPRRPLATKSGDHCPDADDLVWIDLDPTLGHGQNGHRPAIVLTPRHCNIESAGFWIRRLHISWGHQPRRDKLASDLAVHAASALSAALGCLATIVNSERAAGSGRTRPCSQLRNVASGILSALANSACVI